MNEKPILSVIKGMPVHPLPFWLMRQAGRYLPEYHHIRNKMPDFMSLCLNPELTSEITLQPLQRFPLDAAIIFSDILIIPHVLGQAVHFETGKGPILAPFSPIERIEPASFLHQLEPVYQAIGLVKQALSPSQTLIGFAGTPWTLFTYMIQRQETGLKDLSTWISQYPATCETLISVLTQAVILHLRQQYRAGAEVLQVFDSSSSLCPLPWREKWLISPVRQIAAALADSPLVYYSRDVPEVLRCLSRELPDMVLSLDETQDIAHFLQHPVLQGNLSPHTLVEGGGAMVKDVRHSLKKTQGRPHIFNLGHGVLPHTPVEHVHHLAQLIKEA